MNLLSFKKLDSTNKYAKLNIDSLDDKTVISTDIQTAGYGRFERVWVDLGAENIYMTFVLKPSEQINEVYANLTQYLSVCLCKQLETINICPQIKWPNDVLINGKKVCGILAESVIRAGKLKGIVLGIGINLNASFDSVNKIDRPATSLNLELGHAIDKQEFMQNLINIFFKNYDEFLEKGFEYIRAYYENHSLFTIHCSLLKVAVFDKVKEGIFNGFDDNGNLLLTNSEGETEHINMGEIIE